MRIEVYMMSKLVEDWLPANPANDDFRARFYDMFNLEAPAYIGPIERDGWWEQWLNDRYEDAKQLIKEGELEG